MEYLEWTPVVQGSVADWKAANPDATECNLSYRDDITADDIKLLAGIKKLAIRGCGQLGDDAIQHLAGIKILDIGGLEKVTDAAFPSLAGIKSLRGTGLLITDQAITHLAGIEVLVIPYCGQITGSTFSAIKGVRELNCSRCRVTDEAIQAIKGVKHLTTLGCRKLSDEAFSGHEDLITLNITGCRQEKITNRAFSSLVNLRTIMISECTQDTITDEAFENLVNLKELFMSECIQLTDDALAPLVNLTFIDITGCSQYMCGPNLKRIRDSGATIEDDMCPESQRVLPPGRTALSGKPEVRGIPTVRMNSFDTETSDGFTRVPIPDTISDTVHGDVDLVKFMILNTGAGIVLKIKDKFVGISRTYLSDEMESGASTYYECVEEFTSTFEYRDIYNIPYFALKTPLGSLYVKYMRIFDIMRQTHSFWEINETDEVLAFTASRSGVLEGGPIVSADHCQAGTSKKVYDVIPFMFEVEEDEEEVPTTLGLKFGETRVEVDYSPTQTLGELRATIQTKFDIEPAGQRLIYNGRELTDDAKTLNELNVQAGFTVAVMKRGGRRTFRNVRKSRKRKPSN